MFNSKVVPDRGYPIIKTGDFIVDNHVDQKFEGTYYLKKQSFGHERRVDGKFPQVS